MTVANKEGKQEERLLRWNEAFREVGFPARLARAEVLDATSRAMVEKCFDDIGMLPARQGRGDPMVIGRVIGERSGYRRKVISFLIAWFVDSRDL